MNLKLLQNRSESLAPKLGLCLALLYTRLYIRGPPQPVPQPENTWTFHTVEQHTVLCLAPHRWHSRPPWAKTHGPSEAHH